MIRTAILRGGTSKGLYLDRADLPEDTAERDDLLLRLMGSPDERQIDGLGGGHPLTSKVAVVSRAADPATADVDYLFLQVQVDRPLVSAEQPCGNILAGIGPYAKLRGLVPRDAAVVRIRMVNTGGLVIATLGPGEPGDEIEVALEFQQTAGSVAGSLLPTGHVLDEIDGIPVTLIDNGMPVVVVAAASFGLTGHETPAELEADTAFGVRREALRLRAGELMGLGDVADTTVPKVTLISPPTAGGTLATRTFIPHRCHTAIGVLGAVSVATAVALEGSVAAEYATGDTLVRLEHPTGYFDTRTTPSGGAAVLRTARLLIDGTAWPRPAHRS